ncbi:MAG: hypothetical protein KY445_14935, partial [Armatimonadetes bacterium]|nr:hypothetical protein [Armatimonadota bacterium]
LWMTIDHSSTQPVYFDHYLEAKGWLDMAYLYWADEPVQAIVPKVSETARKIRSYAPKLKWLVALHYTPANRIVDTYGESNLFTFEHRSNVGPFVKGCWNRSSTLQKVNRCNSPHTSTMSLAGVFTTSPKTRRSMLLTSEFRFCTNTNPTRLPLNKPQEKKSGGIFASIPKRPTSAHSSIIQASSRECGYGNAGRTR